VENLEQLFKIVRQHSNPIVLDIMNEQEQIASISHAYLDIGGTSLRIDDGDSVIGRAFTITYPDMKEVRVVFSDTCADIMITV
jgi:hypothetical protein